MFHLGESSPISSIILRPHCLDKATKETALSTADIETSISNLQHFDEEVRGAAATKLAQQDKLPEIFIWKLVSDLQQGIKEAGDEIVGVLIEQLQLSYTTIRKLIGIVQKKSTAPCTIDEVTSVLVEQHADSRIGILALIAALQYGNVEVVFGAAHRLALSKSLTRATLKILTKLAAQDGGKAFWSKEAAAWVLAEQQARSSNANLCTDRGPLQVKRQKTASKAVRMLG